MAEAFRGEFGQKVDAKARVSVPAAFRRVLEAGDPAQSAGSRARLVLVHGDPGRRFCECYTIEGMRRLERRILRMPKGDRRRLFLARNMITLSQEIEIDDDGRIVLPPKAREKIGLAGPALREGAEAVFAGMLDSFQIWSRADYEAELARTAELAGEVLPAGEDMLALLPDDEDGADAED